MSDPMMRSPPPSPASLFGTRAQAAGVAARSSRARYAQIISLLQQHGELTLFELAAMLGVLDHQISGRITELLADGRIERTGSTRIKPETGCACDAYRLSHHRATAPDLADRLAEALGYPISLRFGDEGMFDRGPMCREERFPGVPYSRRPVGGAVRVTYRFHLMPCPTCGHPLRARDIVSGGLTPKPTQYICMGSCSSVWQVVLVTDPGQPAMLALVMRTL